MEYQIVEVGMWPSWQVDIVTRPEDCYVKLLWNKQVCRLMVDKKDGISSCAYMQMDMHGEHFIFI